MIPIDKVKKIIERHISLEKELSTGKVEPKLLAKKSKEYSDLKNILSPAKEYIEFEKNKKELPKLHRTIISSFQLMRQILLKLQQ